MVQRSQRHADAEQGFTFETVRARGIDARQGFAKARQWRVSLVRARSQRETSVLSTTR
jgi:hypothetical protein